MVFYSEIQIGVELSKVSDNLLSHISSLNFCKPVDIEIRICEPQPVAGTIEQLLNDSVIYERVHVFGREFVVNDVGKLNVFVKFSLFGVAYESEELVFMLSVEFLSE